MKDQSNKNNLPEDLVSDLKIGRRRIETKSQGWFDLASIEEVKITSIQIGPFGSKENGQYHTEAVGLVKDTEHYEIYPEALIWLPRLEMYGAWDSSHDELHVFPDKTWTDMKSNLIPYIEAQWGSYKGKDKIQHLIVKHPNKYPGAFDFIEYDLINAVKNISASECLIFLKKHEQAILRHPGSISLESDYTALAKVYYILGINNPNEENEWREKCRTILNYHPKGRFYHEKETAAICSWISADFGIQIFQKLLDKGKKQPEYAGGADLISALFNDHPKIDSQIVKLAENPNYAPHLIRCLETAERWGLTLSNDELRKNRKALNSIADVILQIRNLILSAPEGSYPAKEIHLVRSKNVADRISKGWEHLKKKEYSKTEEFVRSALADYPEDAQALFLEARLYWLSSGSAETGMNRARENLLKATRFDTAGIGKLYNMIGCALDELGRYEEAIQTFQQAAEIDHQESIYPANLAEMYWKIGDKQTAAKYARKAKSLGSRLEIVETIFRET
ncbi:tetratricopeptide repeat protein [Leptospira alstonii]|uniref:Tetratricopeptide repeat protein n=2 Tax=Leptospira alstonii TaxID=28452 RepID=M6CUI3_9LEPT|nr:tetratricopeptide repeat protein [Leptospira alstonii]EMJ94161.1 tetratricopeptide repeat protein [Leptospira alstonii serovar Sichuan str. 79601]EQA79273.1 tetratricopeptide repeat protein [Leptospira alstonii serovar Pingchang str. 80-412]